VGSRASRGRCRCRFSQRAVHLVQVVTVSLIGGALLGMWQFDRGEVV
jgi:hypothetical protein